MKAWIVYLGLVVLLALALATPSYPFDRVLAWDAPTENTDGSPVTDLKDYAVKCADGQVVKTTATQAKISFVQATSCFVTAFDTQGNESAPSNTVMPENVPTKSPVVRIVIDVVVP